MRRLPVSLVVLTLAVLAAPRAQAACLSSVPMRHDFDSYFACEDRGFTAALAYQLSAPAAVNTGTERILCEGYDGARCTGMSGSPGDGRATIESDWMNQGVWAARSARTGRTGW